MGRYLLCEFSFRTPKTRRRWSKTNACHSTSTTRRGAQNQCRTDRNEERPKSKVRHAVVVFFYYFNIALVTSRYILKMQSLEHICFVFMSHAKVLKDITYIFVKSSTKFGQFTTNFSWLKRIRRVTLYAMQYTITVIISFTLVPHNKLL